MVSVSPKRTHTDVKFELEVVFKMNKILKFAKVRGFDDLIPEMTAININSIHELQRGFYSHSVWLKHLQ